MDSTFNESSNQTSLGFYNRDTTIVDMLNMERPSELREEDECIEDNLINSTNLIKLLKDVKDNYEDDHETERIKKLRLTAKEKVWKVVRLIKKSKAEGKCLIKSTNYFNCLKKMLLIPGESYLRTSIDSITFFLIGLDLIVSFYEYLICQPKINDKIREVIFDIFFFLYILSNFFTAFKKKKQLMRNFTDIALNYIKMNFLLDFLFTFPFWIFETNLIYLRLIKLYKFPELISKFKVFFFFSSYALTKSLKIRHSLTNIFTFLLILVFVLHITSCLWVFIGLKEDRNNNWIAATNLSDLSSGGKYVASLYFIIETFATIGYGDFTIPTVSEKVFLIFCELLSVGLFAYLISCLTAILTSLSNDDENFIIDSEFEITDFLVEYNRRLENKSKLKLNLEREPTFQEIMDYFVLYYKHERTWIKNFSFLKHLKPRERNKLLDTIFEDIFETYKFFFIGLEASFCRKVALELKPKIFHNDNKTNIVISEKKDIRYFYFISTGIVGVYKNNTEICQLTSGAYFGDEYLFAMRPEFTYKVISEYALFLRCKIKVIKKLCNNYEESFLSLLSKALTRKNKFISIFTEANPESEKPRIKRHTTGSIDVEPLKIKTKTSVCREDYFSHDSLNFDNCLNDLILEKDEKPLLTKQSKIIEDNYRGNESLDDLCINEDIFEDIEDKNKKIEIYNKYLNYTKSIEKKLKFFNHEVSFLTARVGDVLQTSSSIIHSLDKRIKKEEELYSNIN
jgi:hypothetical protein